MTSPEPLYSCAMCQMAFVDDFEPAVVIDGRQALCQSCALNARRVACEHLGLANEGDAWRCVRCGARFADLPHERAEKR